MTSITGSQAGAQTPVEVEDLRARVDGVLSRFLARQADLLAAVDPAASAGALDDGTTAGSPATGSSRPPPRWSCTRRRR